MKFNYLAFILSALLAASCGQNTNIEDEHEHGHGHEEADHAHSEEIVLEPQIAEKFGVQTDTVRIGSFNSSIRVSGEILPSNDNSAIITAPLAGIVRYSSNLNVGSTISKGALVASIDATGVSGGDSNKAALATLNAAKREVERLKPLYEDKLVSASTYNAAQAAYEQAKATYSSSASSGRASAPISGTVTELFVANGEYAQAGSPIASISSDTRLTVRADVPDRYRKDINLFTDARIQLTQDNSTVTISELNGRRINSSNAGSSAGYIPVWFEFNNDGSLVAGATVEIYLLGQSAGDAISIPLTALSEQQGNYYVYQKIDEEGYHKLKVTLGSSDGQRVVITSGLKGGEEIVTNGVTTIRLAENSGVVPEGHSHNH
jgi:RND family efflux transporter MFP subunit